MRGGRRRARAGCPSGRPVAPWVPSVVAAWWRHDAWLASPGTVWVLACPVLQLPLLGTPRGPSPSRAGCPTPSLVPRTPPGDADPGAPRGKVAANSSPPNRGGGPRGGIAGVVPLLPPHPPPRPVHVNRSPRSSPRFSNVPMPVPSSRPAALRIAPRRPAARAGLGPAAASLGTGAPHGVTPRAPSVGAHRTPGTRGPRGASRVRAGGRGTADPGVTAAPGMDVGPRRALMGEQGSGLILPRTGEAVPQLLLHAAEQIPLPGAGGMGKLRHGRTGPGRASKARSRSRCLVPTAHPGATGRSGRHGLSSRHPEPHGVWGGRAGRG